MTKQSIVLPLGGIALILSGVALGWWLTSSGDRSKRELSVETLAARHINLTDSQGHTKAELKWESGQTSLIFFDSMKRERLTLALGENGVAIAVNGREDANQILLSVNDSLRTSSIFISAPTSAINLVGTKEARLKLSDSVTTDSRSASFSIGAQVTKLRLSSNGAESQLWAKNEPARRGSDQHIRSVELDMRTSNVPDARLRVSSAEKPIFQLSASAAKTLSRPR